MRTRTLVILAAIVLAGLTVMSGCRRVPLQDGESWFDDTVRHETVSLGGAKRVEASLDMVAGELKVSGRADHLMDAGFRYRPRSWAPRVDYTVDGDAGELRVSQPKVGRLLGSHTNEWDVSFADDVPIDLSISFGAGEADIDLSSVDLRTLGIEMGAGDITVDLSGMREHGVTADINAGIGSLTLRLPKDVGVRVTGREHGLNEIEADGFVAQGDAYVNDAWGDTATTIDVRIRQGIGEVRLELLD